MASSLPMYYPQSFSISTAVTCATLAEAAYDQYAQWVAQGCPWIENFNWITPDNSHTYSAPLYWTYDLGYYEEPFGFLAIKGSVAYLVFRGTMSDQDIVYDAYITQTPYTPVSGFGNVHSGFLDIYTSLRSQIMSAISTMQGDTPFTELIFTGHSLGCALSSLAVPDVVANGGLGTGVSMLHINMASPRVGDPTFAAAMNNGSVPTFRVVNTEDIVPDSPPAALLDSFYQHFGTPVCFTANYLTVDGNHSLAGSYDYALKNPNAPENAGAVPGSADLAAVASRTPKTDARVGFIARGTAARAAVTRPAIPGVRPPRPGKVG